MKVFVAVGVEWCFSGFSSMLHFKWRAVPLRKQFLNLSGCVAPCGWFLRNN